MLDLVRKLSGGLTPKTPSSRVGTPKAAPPPVQQAQETDLNQEEMDENEFMRQNAKNVHWIEVNLCGMSCDAALLKLHGVVDACELVATAANGTANLDVITGMGKTSEKKKSQLKEPVMHLLRGRGCSPGLARDNPGRVIAAIVPPAEMQEATAVVTVSRDRTGETPRPAKPQVHTPTEQASRYTETGGMMPDSPSLKPHASELPGLVVADQVLSPTRLGGSPKPKPRVELPASPKGAEGVMSPTRLGGPLSAASPRLEPVAEELPAGRQRAGGSRTATPLGGTPQGGRTRSVDLLEEGSPVATRAKSGDVIEEGKQGAFASILRHMDAPVEELPQARIEALSRRICSVHIVSALTLRGLTQQVFVKSLSDIGKIPLYTQMIRKLEAELPKFESPGEETTVDFLQLLCELLNNCHSDTVEAGAVKRDPEARQRWVGSMHLIGNMFACSLVSEESVHNWVSSLLRETDRPAKDEVGCLWMLLSAVGLLTTPTKGLREVKAEYFERIDRWAAAPDLDEHSRHVLSLIQDARSN